MSAFDVMVVAGPVLIVVCDLIIYLLIGRLGKRSTGTGAKFRPFTGGEEAAPRGTYGSELFVFAALFMVAETFVILLSGSFASPGYFYPLLFLAGGSGVILIVTWWLMLAGGLKPK
ncbi:MAG TPA: hypothetical protein VLV31_07240 [Candidatus Acidoferrales bacterium]|nr:hypothetical protein [Candidatus Acidoferrales bacterium]